MERCLAWFMDTGSAFGILGFFGVAGKLIFLALAASRMAWALHRIWRPTRTR